MLLELCNGTFSKGCCSHLWNIVRQLFYIIISVSYWNLSNICCKCFIRLGLTDITLPLLIRIRWQSAHSLEPFLRHSFLSLRWFYLVVLGLGAPLSSLP